MGYMKNSADNRRQSARNSRVQAMSAEEYFEQQWLPTSVKNQIVYWQERMDKLHVNDTGQLRSSITGMLHTGPITTIEHKFLQYGKYVSDGVGREFSSGYTDSMGRTYSSSRGGEGTLQAGQLPFLLPGGEAYREAHGLDKPKRVGPAWKGRVAGGRPRQKRDWFFRKFYAYRMVVNEMAMATYGRAYNGMIAMACDEIFHTIRLV